MEENVKREEWLELVKADMKNIARLPSELVRDVDFMNEVVDLANMYCLDYMHSLQRYNLGKIIVEHNVAKRTVKIADMIKGKFDENGDVAYIEKSASIDKSQMKEMDLSQKVCLYFSRFKKSKVMTHEDGKVKIEP